MARTKGATALKNRYPIWEISYTTEKGKNKIFTTVDPDKSTIIIPGAKDITVKRIVQ